MKKKPFGRHTGRTVDEVVLESADAAISILSYGCVLRDWRVDGAGRSLPVVLGFRTLEDYAERSRSHGIIAGRVANRTADGRFVLDGRTYQLTQNEGPHHLHGGTAGLGKRVWDMETDDASNAVHLRYFSPDGEEGYPGAVEFSVSYQLDGPRLSIEMAGAPDRPTPINLAQHSYYNLGGSGTVRDHVLWVDATAYTPTRDDLIPLGTIEPVEGTGLDFTEARAIEAADPGRIGFDSNLVLDPERDRQAPAARVTCARSGLMLQLWTEEPGLQIFDAPQMTIAARGLEGEIYGPFAGLCLEPQHFPDSLHHPDWPSIIRSPEAPYRQRLVVEIARPKG